jgi:hypothetical protein
MNTANVNRKKWLRGSIQKEGSTGESMYNVHIANVVKAAKIISEPECRAKD